MNSVRHNTLAIEKVVECHGENVAGDEYFLVVQELISALSECEILILARLKCNDIQADDLNLEDL